MPKKNPAKPSGTTRTIRLDTETHRKAKVYAAQNDMDVQVVLKEAVDEYLKKRSA